MADSPNLPQIPTPQRPPVTRRRRWPRLAVYAALIYAAWCATLYVMQDRMLFPADLAPRPMPGDRFDPRSITLRRELPEGGEAVAWLVPPPRAASPRSLPLAVFFHGNAELIDYQDDIVQHYREWGLAVLLPEYRGYGRSAGTPSERAIVDDAAYFLKEALKRPEIDASRVVFHGRSLGGGPAARLALIHPPQALILQSTFTSVAIMAHDYFAPTFLVTNPFHVDEAVGTLDIPTLILHGTRDDIIPVWHARELGRLARHGTFIEFECQHNDFPGDGNDAKYWDAIRQFLTATRIIHPIATTARTPTP